MMAPGLAVKPAKEPLSVQPPVTVYVPVTGYTPLALGVEDWERTVVRVMMVPDTGAPYEFEALKVPVYVPVTGVNWAMVIGVAGVAQ
jgi:hypothetical protein